MQSNKTVVKPEMYRNFETDKTKHLQYENNAILWQPFIKNTEEIGPRQSKRRIENRTLWKKNKNPESREKTSMLEVDGREACVTIYAF